jgi:hypothetical protein
MRDVMMPSLFKVFFLSRQIGMNVFTDIITSIVPPDSVVLVASVDLIEDDLISIDDE